MKIPRSLKDPSILSVVRILCTCRVHCLVAKHLTSFAGSCASFLASTLVHLEISNIDLTHHTWEIGQKRALCSNYVYRTLLYIAQGRGRSTDYPQSFPYYTETVPRHRSSLVCCATHFVLSCRHGYSSLNPNNLFALALLIGAFCPLNASSSRISLSGQKLLNQSIV